MMQTEKSQEVKRKRAEWMNPIDDLLLEELHHTGNLQPSEIADRIDRDRKYVGTRCRKLAEYGLTENMGHGTYGITETGVGYLRGDIDVTELDEL